MTKVRLYVILVLPNVMMELSNIRKKKFSTLECDNNSVKNDVGTAQCEDRTIKGEKKIKKLPNATKELSHVMLELHNVMMGLSSVRKKRNHQM